MKYVDTHAHLDYLEQISLIELLELSDKQNIKKIITISVEPSNLDTVINLANTSSKIFATQGIHPHDAKSYTDQVEAKILSNIKQDKVVAIGEIGLDYHYDHSPRDIQKKVFERQLNIAYENHLPVVFHTREAEDDTISILKNFKKNIKGVFHSFTSNLKLLDYVLEQDFYVSFNGIVTFPKADNVREALKIIPKDKLLVETDCPFLAPVPNRGKENNPLYIPDIVNAISKIRDEDLANVLFENSERLFF